jgi:hypothetical protein
MLGLVSALVLAVSVAGPAAAAAPTVIAVGSFTLGDAWGGVETANYRLRVTQAADGTVDGGGYIFVSYPAYPEPPVGPPEVPGWPTTSYEEMFDLALTCYLREGNQAVVGWEIVDSQWEQDTYVGLTIMIGYQDGPDFATGAWGAPEPTDCAASLADRGFTSVADFIAQAGFPVKGGMLWMGHD